MAAAPNSSGGGGGGADGKHSVGSGSAGASGGGASAHHLPFEADAHLAASVAYLVDDRDEMSIGTGAAGNSIGSHTGGSLSVSVAGGGSGSGAARFTHTEPTLSGSHQMHIASSAYPIDSVAAVSLPSVPVKSGGSGAIGLVSTPAPIAAGGSTNGGGAGLALSSSAASKQLPGYVYGMCVRMLLSAVFVCVLCPHHFFDRALCFCFAFGV